MKKGLLLGILVLVVAASVCLYLYREAHRPKRVWVTFSEKYQDQDYEKDWGNNSFAEERLMWRISGNKGCMALTHDRQKADYVVSISVTRHPTDDLGTFGNANLSITKQNGDVVLADSLYQDLKSAEDIAQQPITEVWTLLCPNQQQ